MSPMISFLEIGFDPVGGGIQMVSDRSFPRPQHYNQRHVSQSRWWPTSYGLKQLKISPNINCDIWSKFWYLVEIVKFGQNCETGISAGVVWEGLADLRNCFWINWKWILTFCLTDNLSEAKFHGEKVTKTILAKCLSDKMSHKICADNLSFWQNV